MDDSIADGPELLERFYQLGMIPIIYLQLQFLNCGSACSLVVDDGQVPLFALQRHKRFPAESRCPHEVATLKIAECKLSLASMERCLPDPCKPFPESHLEQS